MDHPRTCGEKSITSKSTSKTVGSPPHMRGKALFLQEKALDLRITPAHAGKSLGDSAEPLNLRDHPRTCGEKSESAAGDFRTHGSPPHMREKVRFCHRKKEDKRITPAHAGKSFLWLLSPVFRSDHPRTCGEKQSSEPCSECVPGSPPHMRGKVIVVS